MRVWLPPKGLERRYRRFLAKNIAELKREFLARLGHVIRLQKVTPNFAPDYDDPEDPDGLTVRQHSDEIGFLLAGLSAWWLARAEDTRGTMRGYFREVSLFNDNQFRAVVKSQTGLTIPPTSTAPYKPGTTASPYPELVERFGYDADVFRQEPYLDSIRENWTATQETTLNRAANEVISNGEVAIRTALVTSVAADALLGIINNQFQTITKRTDKKADDQINSLDTQLRKERQRSLGADEYIWQTRRDERVRGNPTGLYPKARPSHYDRDGKVFKWSKPPEGGHPGEAPACRCVAILRLPR